VHDRRLRALALLLALALAAPAAAAEHDRAPRPRNISLDGTDPYRGSTPRDAFELIQVVPDPIERFNRRSFALTRGAIDLVVHPLARGWRFATPRTVRRVVESFAYNLGFPVRFVSLLLEGEPFDAAEETAHFAVNSTVGLVGLVDIAGPLGIPTHRADVGLAFARWGIGPGFYLVIPLLGPSSGRDAVGRIFDTALSPTTYLPVVGGVFIVNDLAQRLDTYDALAQSGIDFYALTRGIWSVSRRIDATRYTIPESAYANADPEPSLGVLALHVQDPEFPARVRQVEAVSPRTRRAVPFSLWLQPQKAPIVYLIPGVGTQRGSTSPVALAELAYGRGYSVAVVSSPFHPEFIETGLSSLYPGYTPEDAADLYAALCALDAQLREEHPDQLADARLLGYSLGALEAVFVGALDRAAQAPGALHFTRIMAINPAVDLLYSAQGFDRYYDAPLRWPAGERSSRLNELAMKAFMIAQGGTPPDRPLPVDRTESEFLIGLADHATILSTLAAVRERDGRPQPRPATGAQRDPLVTELNAGSLGNYAEQFAVPYYREARGVSREALLSGASLRSREKDLRSDRRVRALTNADDFILGPDNLAWLRGTLGGRLTVFPDGGHLGNLFVPEVQEVILEGLEAPDLDASRPALDDAEDRRPSCAPVR
jgi:ABC-type transporter lipoprotein component MlaA